MLTYYKVMTTDLGLLTTAADKWDSMAGELKKVETRYGDSVQKISMGQSWTGVSAGVARTSFAATRYEYSAAQIQAKAVASLLRDAHTQFADLKKRVESARDDAIKAGMTVSGQGNVAYDYAELNRSFRDNSSRPEFTQTFLNGMGADNTLKFTNKLNDHAYGDDKGNKQRYLDLQKGLANSLSNAMQDPKSDFYKNFRTHLNKAGLESYDLKQVGDAPNVLSREHGQKVRGYQSLVTLMQNGDGYSTPFLHDLASDIRKVEDKKQGGDPNVWDLSGDLSGAEKSGFAHDPLDGVLGIMSKNPEAATSYLDPGPGHKNDNLQYLLRGHLIWPVCGSR
ncbi:DUF6571 family protein [Streptomyces sp. NPDC086989]|uniref:DUF6571 family protein n=1 Tax=Streptomyces sp. NPDC086989 TaxID=3365764 RepID=UPI0037F20DD3